MHASHMVMGQRNHASHPVVNVVAVEPYEENDDRRDSRPKNFKRKVALNGNSITDLIASSSKTNQAKDQETCDANEQNDSNCEQNLEKFVVNRSVDTGVDWQKIDRLSDPQSPKD
jgi:hypothetical protein